MIAVDTSFFGNHSHKNLSIQIFSGGNEKFLPEYLVNSEIFLEREREREREIIYAQAYSTIDNHAHTCAKYNNLFLNNNKGAILFFQDCSLFSYTMLD